MPTEILSTEVQQTLQQARDAARLSATKTVSVNGREITIPYPFPSPPDWRDCWIYFLMLDRFNNPLAPPKSVHAVPPAAWNQKYDFRQGGTFKGVEQQLDYIASLGARAIWLSPVLKNSAPNWQWNYHGYATQDFLTIDGRFASDGNPDTAAKELAQLIESAHARGLYVVLDIVINHTARVFDYVLNGAVTDSFTSEPILDGPLGTEPPIEWINGSGQPQAAWLNTLPAAPAPDDAVWPADLQRDDFFRRRGNKISDAAVNGGFAKGDFGTMRQMVVEYQLPAGDQSALRQQYGPSPVLSILVLIYEYLIARFDPDGFRIDTVKYVEPAMVETFGNAIREFALSIGKKNFFTFGEIYDDENTIDSFVGRNSTDINGDGYGIDAALDFPLFFILPAIAKGQGDVAALRKVFHDRKLVEKGILSSHGEAGKFFVTFLDNHDQNQRFNLPGTPALQITTGLAVLFCLQGIPCLYYGTEQGLDGTKDAHGNASLGALESVREALWGKPGAFNPSAVFYQQVQLFSALRNNEPALRYGRLYFREVSGNGHDFGHAAGQGGVLAFSRILSDREVLLVANTHPVQPFEGFILIDSDLNRSGNAMNIVYSNLGTAGRAALTRTAGARFYDGNSLLGTGNVTAVPVTLAPMEVQVLTPA